MKRILILLFLIILIHVMPTIGQDIDLSGLSFDELSQLKKDVDLEWRSRPENDFIILDIGEYTGGIEIPEGRYFGYAGSSYDTKTHIVINNENDERVLNTLIYSYEEPEIIIRIDKNYKIRIIEGPILLSRIYLDPSEIYGRNNNIESGTKIPTGTYVIGEEIPAGSYNIYYDNGRGYSIVYIFPNKEIYLETGMTPESAKPYQNLIKDSNDGSKVVLFDGQIIRVTHPIIMEKNNMTFDF